jgi:uncharacterized protein YjiS (DUF1127 family)
MSATMIGQTASPRQNPIRRIATALNRRSGLAMAANEISRLNPRTLRDIGLSHGDIIRIQTAC